MKYLLLSSLRCSQRDQKSFHCKLTSEQGIHDQAAGKSCLWASVLKELILGLDSDPLGTSHSHLQKKEMLTVHVIVLSFSLFCGIIHGQSLRKPILVGNRPVHRSMHPHATWDMKACTGSLHSKRYSKVTM